MSDELVFLIESRGAAALVYGLAIGTLLRLLGLSRNRGAAAAAVAVAATFLPAGWPAAHLMALALGLCGLAGRLARPREALRPGWLDVSVVALVSVGCSWGAALHPLAGLWQAAAVAALGTGSAAWIAGVLPPSAGATRYRLPSLSPRRDGRGIPAPTLMAAAATPFAVAALAWGLGLLGAGESGPTALGGTLALLALGHGRSRALGALASALGAVAGAALTAFLS